MTDLLPIYQVAAGLGALAIIAILVFAIVIRRSGAAVASVLVRAGLIPAVAFTYYALYPVDLNPLTLTTWVGLGLVVMGAMLGLLNRRFLATMRRSGADPRLLRRQVQVGVAAVYCLTIGISFLVWMFEPAFAVANIGLSLAWAVAWLPERFRRASSSVSVDVDADPSRAWDLIVDPTQRAHDQPDLLEYSVEPPGPLRLGSTITTRLRVPLRRQVEGMTEFAVEYRYLVTEFVPGSTLTTSALEMNAITKTELTPIGSGTRITISFRARASVWMAIAGAAMERRRSMRHMAANQESALGKVKELLASPA